MEIQFSQIVFFAKKLSHHFTIEAIIHLKIGHFNRLRSYISFNDRSNASNSYELSTNSSLSVLNSFFVLVYKDFTPIFESKVRKTYLT